MANKQKLSKKPKTNLSKVRLATAAILGLLILVGAVFTAKQYLAYRSLDSKIDQIAELLRQKGVENITKKDECAAVKLGTPVHCSLSLSIDYPNISPENAKSIFDRSVEIIDAQDLVTLHSNLSDNVFSDNDGTDSITKLENSGLGYRGECSASISSRSASLDGNITCGYKAWWKQIL